MMIPHLVVRHHRATFSRPQRRMEPVPVVVPSPRRFVQDTLVLPSSDYRQCRTGEEIGTEVTLVEYEEDIGGGGRRRGVGVVGSSSASASATAAEVKLKAAQDRVDLDVGDVGGCPREIAIVVPHVGAVDDGVIRSGGRPAVARIVGKWGGGGGSAVVRLLRCVPLAAGRFPLPCVFLHALSVALLRLALVDVHLIAVLAATLGVPPFGGSLPSVLCIELIHVPGRLLPLLLLFLLLLVDVHLRVVVDITAARVLRPDDALLLRVFFDAHFLAISVPALGSDGDVPFIVLLLLLPGALLFPLLLLLLLSRSRNALLPRGRSAPMVQVPLEPLPLPPLPLLEPFGPLLVLLPIIISEELPLLPLPSSRERGIVTVDSSLQHEGFVHVEQIPPRTGGEAEGTEFKAGEDSREEDAGSVGRDGG
mmetsp:Transcript_7967/g.23610  ORF Transcript_7967/g.23610 Transcript_7967/m.23610 type:complete len:421 (+) Transcript_7967:417-1679(+)